MKAYIFRKKYCLLHPKGFIQRHVYIGCAQVQKGEKVRTTHPGNPHVSL